MDQRETSLSSVFILYIANSFVEEKWKQNAANLLGKVDLGAIELGLEVVNVSAEKDEGYGEDANEDGGGLALGGGSLNDDAVLSHNLDALDVVACVLVGVTDVLVVELGLALSGVGVNHLPGLLDLISVPVVVAVVLILLLVLLGGDAIHVHEGLRGVGELVAAGHLVVEVGVVLNKVGAELIGEDTHEDLAALVGAVGAHEVLDLLLCLLELSLVAIVAVVAIVVLPVVVGVLVEVDLAALEHLLDLDLLIAIVLLVLVLGLVGVLVDAVVHASVNIAVISAVLLVVGVLTVAGGLGVDLAVLELVLPVGLEEGVHVDDVVAVVAAAAAGVLVGARGGGAEAEADEALGLDEGLVLSIGLLVPLGDVVASLELDGVVGDPGELHLLVLVLLLLLVELTGLGEDAVAELGVGLDGAGGNVLAGNGDLLGRGNGEGGRESGESELHLLYCCWVAYTRAAISGRGSQGEEEYR